MSSPPLHPPLPDPQMLLIDDHTLFRTGMRMIVQSFPGIGGVVEAASVMLAREHEGLAVDVILLDIHMPGLNGLDGLNVLRGLFPAAKVIFVSASDTGEAVADASQRGADGFLPKSASAQDIFNAISTVLSGGKCFPEMAGMDGSFTGNAAGNQSGSMSARQLQVIALLAQGKSNKLIARELNLSENTIRVHVAALFTRFEVNSRTAAVLAAQQAGLITVS